MRRFLLVLILLGCSLLPSISGSIVTNGVEVVDVAEETVYVTKTGEKYHRGSCGYLSKSKRAIGLSDAKAAGYTPCSRCKPTR